MVPVVLVELNLHWSSRRRNIFLESCACGEQLIAASTIHWRVNKSNWVERRFSGAIKKEKRKKRFDREISVEPVLRISSKYNKCVLGSSEFNSPWRSKIEAIIKSIIYHQMWKTNRLTWQTWRNLVFLSGNVVTAIVNTTTQSCCIKWQRDKYMSWQGTLYKVARRN